MGLWAKGLRFSPMTPFPLAPTLRIVRPTPAVQLVIALVVALAVALALVGPARLIAQIEGDRGIAPIANSTDIEVGNIQVNTQGKTGDEARLEGWREAQKKAWELLKGPAMSDGQIESMVSAVVIQHEQIGPRRYIATLGVIFDRGRAGQFVGGPDGSTGRRSAPLLVIPILYSGGSAQVYEVRGPWQKAWAEFRTGASPIDYVRPSGAGGDSLLVTAGQAGRRSRLWWRNVLDQFGASDVIMPIARLERQWPGGPVVGTFTARYGPDSTFLESFTLRTKDDSGVDAMLGQALVRLDQIYAGALAAGTLHLDPTLALDRPQLDASLAALIAAGQAQEKAAAVTSVTAGPGAIAGEAAPATAAVATSITIQFASPDAAAVDAAVAGVRGVAGVQSASTTSIAIGGTSVMRVSYAGELSALAAALRDRGFKVTAGSNALSIKR